MKITIIGTGYVGLVTGTCFAEMGHEVWCVDNDSFKIAALNIGEIPIYEPGLKEMVLDNKKSGRLGFTTSIEVALKDAEYVFIAVGTPPDEDGSADLSHVLAVAGSIGFFMDHCLTVINKSTVPVGTAQKVREEIQKQLDLRGEKLLAFDVVSNPEFLKEGDAINDFMRPDRVVIGVEHEPAEERMVELYESFVRNGHTILAMDIPSSEMTKYAANAMLATRISFMNELSGLCKLTGANIENIRKGIGSDKRIGMSFLYAGIGYGGSCFPKDVDALRKTFEDNHLEPRILNAVERTNYEQINNFLEMIDDHYGKINESMSDKTFAVWGLSFKPQTDDVRESPAIKIIITLVGMGAKVQVHDPVAMENTRKIFGDKIKYYGDQYTALDDVDALLLLTEWREFRNPDFYEMFIRMKGKVIFDGRNQYDPEKMREAGFEYYSIGR
jgi:UDPglucose 6-dehydrogenase